MEDMASLWSYQESIDELKQKLLCTIVEIDSVRVEANEELRKNNEYAKQLLQLLNIACQERDEARNQLQTLFNNVIPSTNQTESFTTLPRLQPVSPIDKPTKPNSSITESNSLSEAYNYHSHDSSPINSFFDNVSSPEFPSINIGDSINIPFVNKPLIHDYNGTISTGLIPSGTQKIDRDFLVIDNLAKGKNLPDKGKFLQSLLEAGPLLQTLLMAGPLPRWRNPPPLLSLHIPPVTIKSCDAEIASSHVIPSSVNSQSYVELACGSQMLSTSMLNFSNRPSGLCLGNGPLLSANANSDGNIPAGKRQRFQ